MIPSVDHERWLFGAFALALCLLAMGAPVKIARAVCGEGSCVPNGPFGVPGLQDPNQYGEWGPVQVWPEQATHINLLSSGKVLFWRGQSTGSDTYLWDPKDPNTLPDPNGPQAPSGHYLFCSGHAALDDGRVIAIGGGPSPAFARDEVSVFDPDSETWSALAPMHRKRWYPTATTLPDGRILATLGNITGGTEDTPEVYDPKTHQWTELTDANQALGQTYAPMFVLPNGKVLNASRDDPNTRTLDVDAPGWTVVATSNFNNEQGCAAMYEPGKVLKVGGETSNKSERIDMTVTPPAWTITANSMAHARRRCDLVILPDGSVLVVGGASGSGKRSQSDPDCAVHAAEIWDPDTDLWTTMASTEKPRLYHSTALLLPDGRVLAAGGENDPNCPHSQPGERNMEIYSPPYLFQGARPTIDLAPKSVAYGTIFQVDTPDALSLSSVVFVRPGSVTHNTNQTQRYVRLDVSLFTQTQLDVLAPDENLAPPGYYMLFIVDNNGVPSEARFMLVGPDEDGDGWVDAEDNCPNAPNADQADSETAAGFDDPNCGTVYDNENLFGADELCDTPDDLTGDGIGDACDPCLHFANNLPLVINGFFGIPDECQCGDFDGDGHHSATDASAISQCAAFVRFDCVSERDEVDGNINGFYSATDASLVNRVAAFLDPAYTLECGIRPEGTCSDAAGVTCIACSDGIDNDEDGDIDYPDDAGCDNKGDYSE